MSSVLRFRARRALLLTALVLGPGCASGGLSSRTSNPAGSYRAYVASEASDLVTELVFTPGSGIRVVRNTGIGEAGRIVGPHGVAAAPDGKSWYVALSHGLPDGRVAKYDAVRDTLIARVNVGPFPETITMTPDGQYLFVANHDLHGVDAISGVSIIFAPTMTEVARPNTCVRPIGGSFDVSAATFYSACGASDEIVAIDAHTFRVIHRFSVVKGEERAVSIEDRSGRRPPATCLPLSVQAGRALRAHFVYVACSRSNEILEIDVSTWSVTRRFPAAGEPYELATDNSGRLLLATLHADSTVLAIDLDGGNVRAHIATTQPSPHTVRITSDGRYAFVSSEGGGTAKGTVDVIDLATLTRIASAAIGYGVGALALVQR